LIRFRARRLVACLLLVGAVNSLPARASTQTVYFDDLNAGTTTPPIAAGDVLFVDAHVRGQTGTLGHAVTFSVAAGVTSVSGRATWAISTADGPGPRLIGVNFDLFDANDVLVTSDTFAGTLAGQADSTFASTPLSPGIYTLRASGTGVREVMYDLALEFVGTPPPSAAIETGSLPLQGASTSGRTAFFTTLQDERTLATPLSHRDTLLVDTLVTAQVGTLAQGVSFTPAPGIDRFHGEIVWMISEAAGTGPRLLGVNVDVFDAEGVLVASDAFAGTLAGFAYTTLAGTLGSGVHRIVVGGSAVRDASLGLSLSVIDDDVVFSDGFE
jgi:hypothetical protein